MRRFAMPCTRFLASSLVIMAMAGCISTALHHSTTSYYAEGPEQALRALDHAPIRQQDRILAGMERAVALQELGRYRDSNAELFECQRLLEASRPDATGLLINDEVALYRGESFEQIYLHTLAISNSLALQDVFAAADQAQHALGAIQTVGCRSCRFPFTRYLAALAFEAAGQCGRAVDTLAEAVAESPGHVLLVEELDRIAGQDDCPSPGGPSSAACGERVLVVILLLGRGPQKVEAAVPVPLSHAVAWPEYMTRGPQAVAGAAVVVDHREHPSVELTDLESLARASLHERRSRLIPKEVGKTVVQEVVVQEIGDEVDPAAEWLARVLFSLADRADLRHWSTLPSSCQVLRISLDRGCQRCALVYRAPDGREVDRELLELAIEWTEGPLFVTRRMP